MLPIKFESLNFLNKVQKYDVAYPVVIIFGNTWSPVCRGAYFQISSFSQKYPNVYYLVLMQDEETSFAKDYISSHISQLTQLDVAVSSEQYHKLLMQYSINSLPSTLMFKYNGKLLFQGHPCCEELVQLLEKAEKFQDADSEH